MFSCFHAKKNIILLYPQKTVSSCTAMYYRISHKLMNIKDILKISLTHAFLASPNNKTCQRSCHSTAFIESVWTAFRESMAKFHHVHSQTSEVVISHSSWISQLFAHCASISDIETIITHSAPLSIAVHLHQTLTGVAAFAESNHTIVWVAPNTRSDCK